MTNGDITPRAAFGQVLKHLREQAGLSQEQLGTRLKLSATVVRKVENGQRGATAQFVELCEDVPELGSGGLLRMLFDQLREHFNRPYPEWFAKWPELENQAVRLKAWELAVIPGPLQTEAYARALLTGRIGFNGDVDEAVTARMDRQKILTRDDPVELFAVVDEHALHRPVGGAGVMGEQLKHLINPPPRTILQVIPAATGVHDGLPGAFTVADFTDGSSAAYLDSGLRGMVIQDSPEDVAELAATWLRLAAEALPRSASLTLIEEIGQKWNQ